MAEHTAQPAQLLDVSAALGRHPAHDVGAGTPAALIADLDRYGISEAVVAHTLATHHHPASGNVRVLAETADEPRLHACWTVLPSSCGELPDGPALVSQASANGVVMLTARPHAHGFALDGPDLASLLDTAAGHELPMLVDLAETDWPALEKVTTAHPDLWLILTNVGYRELRRMCGFLDRHSRVLVCMENLSGHLALEYLVARFGSHRLVFGTGHPVRDPAEAVVRLMWSELDDADVRAIGGETMRGLLGLRPALEAR